MPGRLHYTDVATVSISLRTEETLRVEALEETLVAPLKRVQRHVTKPRRRKSEQRDKEVLDLVKSERSRTQPFICSGRSALISAAGQPTSYLAKVR